MPPVRAQLRVFLATVLGATVVMSGLAANSSNSAGPADCYGKELPIVGQLGCGPVMDAVVCGRWAYVIGEGNLFIADALEPAQPRVVGRLAGLGNTRQIVVAHDVAYVSSREDGLFIVSVKSPTNPKLLCRYDPIEWATGLAISGDVLFVACRNFGVELVDVSRPEKPAHLSVARTGEAQSVIARNGWLYAGVWGTSEVVVVNAHNPRKPKIVARAPLDGYGDGVDVRGQFLYAATGHHSREPHKDENAPGFGRGHGLEIFDLSDPARPVLVSRLKFPKFYAIGNDMWSLTVSGDHAFVADTHNGIFVVDVSDARHPRCVAHRQLPFIASRKRPGFVGGLALAPGYIYAAGGWTDMHVLAAPDLARPATPEPDDAPAIPPAAADENSRWQVYKSSGQVHAVAFLGDTAFAACGSAGIHAVKVRPEVKPLAAHQTEDFATDICTLSGTVYVAEGAGGLSIWSANELGELKLLGRYRVQGQRVRHVAVPPPGHYALVQVAGGMLHIVDVSDPAQPALALKDTQFGLLYGNQIMDGLIKGRYAAVFWHVSGLHWYDLYGGTRPVALGQKHSDRFNMLDGVAVFDGKALTPRRGGYVLLALKESQSLDDLPPHCVERHRLTGRPTICGHCLYLANRATGEIRVLNIRDPTAPKLLDAFTTPGNPGRIVSTRDGFLIPDGYNGLLVCKQTQ